MIGEKGRLALKIILTGVIFSVTLTAYGALLIIIGRMFVAWYVPVGIAFAFSVISGIVLFPVWQRITGLAQPWVNIVVNIIVVTGVLSTLLLCINNYCGEENIYSDKGIVERVYRETHYNYRRVAKGVYSRGAPYYVYKGKIALSDGRAADIRLKYKEYQALSKNDTLVLKMRRGLFGWDEVLTDSIQLPAQEKRKKTKSGKYIRNKIGESQIRLSD